MKRKIIKLKKIINRSIIRLNLNYDHLKGTSLELNFANKKKAYRRYTLFSSMKKFCLSIGEERCDYSRYHYMGFIPECIG